MTGFGVTGFGVTGFGARVIAHAKYVLRCDYVVVARPNAGVSCLSRAVSINISN